MKHYVILPARRGILARPMAGIPSPRLAQAGGGQAWRTAEGVWRLRDDDFDRDHMPLGERYVDVVVKEDERPALKPW